MTVTQQQNQDWSIWEERWLALNQTLTDLASDYDGLTSEEFPRKETLTYLVKHLQAFGEKQFRFFWNGFAHIYGQQKSGEPSPELEESDVFQPEYVLQATLDQISHDLEVIQRAANARLPNSPKRMRDTLEIADRLAWKYLQPALDNLVEQGTTVLTYFQKSPSIRLIPYAPVALIGIPPTAILNAGDITSDNSLVARDLLSTAHEVGHYIYRRGTTAEGEPIYRELDSALNQMLGITAALLNKWTEEIFADVYGCLSGGAVTALSSQDLALQYYSKTEFDKDDGEHPAPILRPDIYVEVLNQKGNRTMARELGRKWDGHRTRRNAGDKIRFEHDQQVKISDVILPESDVIAGKGSGTNPEKPPINRIISKVLDILEKVDLNPSGGGSGADKLYRNFRDDLFQENQESDNLDLGVPSPDPWQKWIEEEEFFTNNQIPTEPIVPGSGRKEDINSKQPPEKDTWIPVAYCAGWTTKIGNHSGG